MSNHDNAQVKTPLRVGALIFPGFQALDLFGPLDILNNLSFERPLTLSIISTTLDLVSTEQPKGLLPLPGITGLPVSTNFNQSIAPTHTLATAPPLDMLVIPGGLGTEAIEATQPHVDFVKRVYPSLTYLFTVCSGSTIPARAGVLNNKRATTNKAFFNLFTSRFANINWVSHARWVVDEKLWTASGVTAGMDAMLAWIEAVYGTETADKIAMGIEYRRIKDSTLDEFAELHGLGNEPKE